MTAGSRGRGAGALAAGLSAAVLSIGLSGCVLSDEVGGSNNAPPPTTTLPTEVAEVGTAVEHGGVTVTVRAVSSFDQSPKGQARIRVVMHSENLDTAARRNPDVRLMCDESERYGDWFSGSTWEPNFLLPVNATNDGEVIIGFPDKAENPQYTVASCTNPKLVLDLGDPRSLDEQRVVLDVPAEVISEALVRPRGPNLPLPDAAE